MDADAAQHASSRALLEAGRAGSVIRILHRLKAQGGK